MAGRIDKLLPFLFKFLFPAFCLTASCIVSYGETWSEKGLIRISSKLNFTLAEPPQFLVTADYKDYPDLNKFQAFHNREDRSLFSKLFGNGSVWIRVVINNPFSEDRQALIRLLYHCRDFSVYYKNDSGQWNILKIGSDYPENRIEGSHYEAAGLSLHPGNNTLYLHHVHSMDKWPLDYIDFVHPGEIADDRGQFLDSSEGFLFILIAFLFVIIFQLGYVGLQWYYHRRKEYLDYLVYLMLIGCYFYIRDSIILRDEFFLRHFSEPATLVNDMLLFLPYLFYLRFARHFINMQDRFPDKNRQIKTVEKVIAAMVVVILFVSWFTGQQLTSLIAFGVLVPLFAYTLWLFVFFYKKHDNLIRFLLLGSICAATGHFLAMLLSGVPALIEISGIPPIYATITGLVLEIFFFNTGLGYKAKYEQDEKLKLKLEYYKQIEETRKVQDKLQQMRNNIANDLHDDVGSTLSSIGIYSQLAFAQIDKNPLETRVILDKISKATQRMMESMSDIVWAIHSRNDEGVDLFTRMQQFAVDHLGLSGILFEMVIDPKALKLSFSMEARRNLMLLFKEIIHNASKYSMGTLVNCHAAIEGNHFELIINDNGVGFDAISVKKGIGLPGLVIRTRSLGGSFAMNSAISGTSVKISLPLSNIVS